MKQSGFFNSVNGDRTYSAEDWAAFFASFISNGVMPKPSDALQVVADTGMKVKIKVGRAWINGYFLNNEQETIKTLANADGVLKRIDRIVARWDLVNRQITLEVKQGAYNSTPVAPALTRTADIYELALADILVGNGALSITQSAITDQRLNGELCGVSAGIIQQIDTTAFNAQLHAWMGEFQTASREQFESWFGTIRDVLSENAAGNLLNKMNEIRAKTRTITIPATGWATYSSSSNDYTKKKAIAVTGLTSNDVVFLNYDLESKSAAQDAVASHVESEAGQIVIYAESVPSKDLTATLVVQKGGQ